MVSSAQVLEPFQLKHLVDVLIGAELNRRGSVTWVAVFESGFILAVAQSPPEEEDLAQGEVIEIANSERAEHGASALIQRARHGPHMINLLGFAPGYQIDVRHLAVEGGAIDVESIAVLVDVPSEGRGQVLAIEVYEDAALVHSLGVGIHQPSRIPQGIRLSDDLGTSYVWEGTLGTEGVIGYRVDEFVPAPPAATQLTVDFNVMG